MAMADSTRRIRLYEEYKELDDRYRTLADKLKPFLVTDSNRADHEQLRDIGHSMISKYEELMEASGIKRIP